MTTTAARTARLAMSYLAAAPPTQKVGDALWDFHRTGKVVVGLVAMKQTVMHATAVSGSIVSSWTVEDARAKIQRRARVAAAKAAARP